MKQEKLEVTLENHVLPIRGSRKYEAGQNERQMLLGRSYGDFALHYTLPESADGEQLAAYLTDGVPTLRVPKHPKAQLARIEIGNPNPQVGRCSVVSPTQKADRAPPRGAAPIV